MTVQRRAFQPQNDEDTNFSSTRSNVTLQRQQLNKHDGPMKKERVIKKRHVQNGTNATAATRNTSGIYNVIRLILGCLITSCALSYFVTGDSLFWGHRPWYTRMDNLRAWIVRYWDVSFSFSPLFI